MPTDKQKTQLITDETLSHNRLLYKSLEAVQDALNKRMQKELHGVRKGSSKPAAPKENAAG